MIDSEVLDAILQLDVASSQLLVTDNDFKDPEFRQQLSETVNSLLELRVVPVFNENDAISTRKAPYKVNLLIYSLSNCSTTFSPCPIMLKMLENRLIHFDLVFKEDKGLSCLKG